MVDDGVGDKYRRRVSELGKDAAAEVGIYPSREGAMCHCYRGCNIAFSRTQF